MRLHGSLTGKHFLAQLKRRQWRRRRMGEHSPSTTTNREETQQQGQTSLPSPRLNKPRRGVGEMGGCGGVKKIFQPFYPSCCHPNSFCQPLSHIIYKAGRQTIDLASFLHSISWLWHWQGRSGEECKMGECGERAQVRGRGREGQRREMKHLVKISSRVAGCKHRLLSTDRRLISKYLFHTPVSEWP